jgi:phage pi2 protein 07
MHEDVHVSFDEPLVIKGDWVEIKDSLINLRKVESIVKDENIEVWNIIFYYPNEKFITWEFDNKEMRDKAFNKIKKQLVNEEN